MHRLCSSVSFTTPPPHTHTHAHPHTHMHTHTHTRSQFDGGAGKPWRSDSPMLITSMGSLASVSGADGWWAGVGSVFVPSTCVASAAITLVCTHWQWSSFQLMSEEILVCLSVHSLLASRCSWRSARTGTLSPALAAPHPPSRQAPSTPALRARREDWCPLPPLQRLRPTTPCCPLGQGAGSAGCGEGAARKVPVGSSVPSHGGRRCPGPCNLPQREAGELRLRPCEALVM